MGKSLNPGQELGTAAVYRRLARNSAYLAGGTAASAIFMMLAAVLNARALTAREFGLLVLFQSATMMVATLMSFSTQQPIIKLGSSAVAEGDTARLGRLVGLGLLIDVIAAVMSGVAAFVFLWVGRSWVDLPNAQLGLAALFAASLFFTGYLTSNGIFRLLDRFGLLSLIQAGCAAMLLAATAYLFASAAPFEAYCWIWAIFYVLNSQLPLCVALVLVRRAGVPISLSTAKMGKGEVRSFLAYCWSTWGMATTEGVRSNGDSLLVGAAVSVEAAGIYNVAKQLAGVLRKLNTVYASAAFPEISALFARGAHESARRVRQRMLWVGGAIGLSLIAAALVAGGPLLRLLFGERFEAAWIPLVFLTAAAAAQLITHTLSMYVQVYVGPGWLLRVYLLAMVAFLVTVFPLTSGFSINGTAAAQLLFSIALIYLCQVALRRAPHAP